MEEYTPLRRGALTEHRVGPRTRAGAGTGTHAATKSTTTRNAGGDDGTARSSSPNNSAGNTSAKPVSITRAPPSRASVRARADDSRATGTGTGRPGKPPSTTSGPSLSTLVVVSLGVALVALAAAQIHWASYWSLAHSDVGHDAHWATSQGAAWRQWRELHYAQLRELDAHSRADEWSVLRRWAAVLASARWVRWEGLVLVGGVLLGLRSRVVYQSLTPLPGLGVQLATTRALTLYGRSVRTATSRRFIPLGEIESVVIHEALCKWNVVYYLGIVRRGDVVVAFEDVRPRLEVLVEVYHHVQEQLFDKNTS